MTDILTTLLWQYTLLLQYLDNIPNQGDKQSFKPLFPPHHLPRISLLHKVGAATNRTIEWQDKELKTSRLIVACSNSFKDKTEDGWVVTRAKTKVSGRLNFLPLSEMFCTAVWSSTQHQTSVIFSPGGSRGAADFPLPRGAQGL